jgi:diguanylate cyclase (GGDEF)-like protein
MKMVVAMSKTDVNRSPPTVLVVDDNQTNLDVLSRRLERDGYKVVTRDNAIDLEADIALAKPDIILLDWMMPVRTGYDALCAVREIHDSSHLPIIMVTARDESRDITSAIEAGANDFVTKPIDFAVLRSRLEGALARRADTLRQDNRTAELDGLVAQRTSELQAANLALQSEIAERTNAEKMANRLARRDHLCGLPNRFHFLEQLKRHCAGSGTDNGPFALIYVDLDRFRSVNSVHGPLVGDAMLVEVAGRLAQAFDETAFVARVAADEFAIIVPSVSDEQSGARHAERALQILSQPFRHGDRHIAMHASIAIMLSGPLPADDVLMLVECDAALRTAQRKGGGQISVFNDALRRSVRDHALIKDELAIGIPNGEFVPFFQPTVSLISGEVETAEVLARWKHPLRGLVSPALFIPAAEETGLVDDLFWALLPKACLEAKQASQTLRIALNLSPSQILDQWFPSKVLCALNRSGFPAHRLEIEVTETAMFADIRATRIALNALRDQGVTVALDDFGVGYSSLSLLRELPITKVKIDRSFTSEIEADEAAAALVRGVIDLSKSMGLCVTAEGVEDVQIAEKLASWGCDFGQGYWFGRPADSIVLQTPWTDRIQMLAA